MTDIYAASEDPIPGVTGEALADIIREKTGQDVTYMSGFDAIQDYLVSIVRPGDLVMTIGAGNIVQLGENLVKALERRQASEKE